MDARSARTALSERLGEAQLVLRYAAQLEGVWWAEAMATVAHVRNRVPSARDPDTTPHTLFLDKKQFVAHMRVFGCRAWVGFDPG
jgi:hypothetical protein